VLDLDNQFLREHGKAKYNDDTNVNG